MRHQRGVPGGGAAGVEGVGPEGTYHTPPCTRVSDGRHRGGEGRCAGTAPFPSGGDTTLQGKKSVIK